jgi:galactokinase
MSAEKLQTIEELQAELLDAYRKEFPNDEPNICAFAPGRVNLIGEHSDYNHSFVFPMAIPVGTMILGQALSEDINEDKSFEFDQTEKTISPIESPKWGNYVIGVLALFLERIKPNKKLPFRAFISTSVPIGGGLSSSASIEVAMCTFLEILYQDQYAKDLQLSKVDKALLCTKAEQKFANVPCGIMDQYASCMGKAGHAILIDCQNNTSKLIPFNDKDVCILVTNSNVKHELVSGKFAENVQHCQDAAKILGHKKLRDVSLIEELEQGRNKMPETTHKRAHHVVTEMQRTQAGAEALENNDYEEFGRLMYESHESLQKHFEVSCEELDQLVELARSVDGVYGSRMTGAGFGKHFFLFRLLFF